MTTEPYRRTEAGFSPPGSRPPVGKAAPPKTGGSLTGINATTVLIDDKPVDPSSLLTIRAGDLAALHTASWTAGAKSPGEQAEAIGNAVGEAVRVANAKVAEAVQEGRRAAAADAAAKSLNGMGVRIEYDAEGHISRVVRPDGAVRFVHDEAGRLIGTVRE